MCGGGGGAPVVATWRPAAAAPSTTRASVATSRVSGLGSAAVHWSHGLPRSLLRALQGVRHEGICTLGHQDSFCLKFDHISKMSTKKHRESESLEENE